MNTLFWAKIFKSEKSTKPAKKNSSYNQNFKSLAQKLFWHTNWYFWAWGPCIPRRAQLVWSVPLTILTGEGLVFGSQGGTREGLVEAGWRGEKKGSCEMKQQGNYPPYGY